MVALVVALPLHFINGFGTVGHLGPIYLDALILLAGTVVAYTGLKKDAEGDGS